MRTLAQDNPKVYQGTVSYNMSNLQQFTCISIRAFDRSTAKQSTTSTCTCISIRPVLCAKTVLLSSYLLQCIPLHYYALLLFVEPCLDHIKLAHNRGVELFVNLVTVGTQAGHIGGTAPVHELLINKYFITGMLFIYLSLNGNEISSVIQPAKFDLHDFTYMYIPLLVCRWAACHSGPLL